MRSHFLLQKDPEQKHPRVRVTARGHRDAGLLQGEGVKRSQNARLGGSDPPDLREPSHAGLPAGCTCKFFLNIFFH